MTFLFYLFLWQRLAFLLHSEKNPKWQKSLPSALNGLIKIKFFFIISAIVSKKFNFCNIWLYVSEFKPIWFILLDKYTKVHKIEDSFYYTRRIIMPPKNWLNQKLEYSFITYFDLLNTNLITKMISLNCKKYLFPNMLVIYLENIKENKILCTGNQATYF